MKLIFSLTNSSMMNISMWGIVVHGTKIVAQLTQEKYCRVFYSNTIKNTTLLDIIIAVRHDFRS